MSSISRKTVAWATGAALVVGGCTAGVVLATHGGGSADGSAAAQGVASAPAPLELVSVSPISLSKTSATQAIDGAGTIVVTYNQRPPARTPLPRLSPVVAGAWQRTGDAVIFTPEQGYAANTHFTVTVPGLGDAHNRSESSSFITGGYSTLRLQEILAQLGYLPLTWTPDADASVPSDDAKAQMSAAYLPPAGRFQWQGGYPAKLGSLWSPGQANTLDRGAVTGFEADHNLPTDGIAGPAVWKALLTAAAANQRNTHGYSYAIANQNLPETLTIWHDGKRVFSSLANTGMGGVPTALGTYPVYEKLPFQIMSGTNPDGSHYADPVQWVSYFDGGEAVHYYPRGSYGYPQSLGCVELPYTAAKDAYPYLPYGTLVTVAA